MLKNTYARRVHARAGFAKQQADKTMSNPFSLPAKLSPDLARVRDYWDGLKRGENKIPFADDVNLSGLSRFAEPSDAGRCV